MYTRKTLNENVINKENWKLQELTTYIPSGFKIRKVDVVFVKSWFILYSSSQYNYDIKHEYCKS
jgi:hypothetical protein